MGEIWQHKVTLKEKAHQLSSTTILIFEVKGQVYEKIKNPKDTSGNTLPSLKITSVHDKYK